MAALLRATCSLLPAAILVPSVIPFRSVYGIPAIDDLWIFFEDLAHIRLLFSCTGISLILMFNSKEGLRRRLQGHLEK